MKKIFNIFRKSNYFLLPKKIKNNFNSFNYLINFYNEIKYLKNEEIIIDFKETEWFEANLCAFLGAIFIELENNNNKLEIKIEQNQKNEKVIEILKKNEFLNSFGIEKLPDKYNTTIPFRIFSCHTNNDRIDFQKYLNENFFPYIRNNINMSSDFENDLSNNLEEVYQNARIHGHSQSIVTCGQYFPKLYKVKLTIVDLGVTISENVKKIMTFENDSLAIDWATKLGNTSKEDNESGGLGLYNLQSFIKKNQGKMHIISNYGYWGLSFNKSHNIEKKLLENKFKGTIVNLEFNLKDASSYYTDKETSQSDPFIKLIEEFLNY